LHVCLIAQTVLSLPTVTEDEDALAFVQERATDANGWWVFKRSPPPPPPPAQTCADVASHPKSLLLAAARLSNAVYSESDFKNLKSIPGVGSGLKAAYYMKDGPHYLDFGEADPITGHQQVAWIVFAGSESMDDWKANVNIALTGAGHGMGKVHKGISKQWDAARKEVEKHVSLLEDQGVRRIFFTGHSLGAAIAMMGAAEVEQKLQKNKKSGAARIELITFGGPVIGDEKFAQELNEMFRGRMTRVVMERDPIPCGPPSFVYSYDVDGLMFYDSGDKRWRRERDHSCSSVLTWFDFAPADHAMSVYISTVEARCM
jgi:hypothetical protein